MDILSQAWDKAYSTAHSALVQLHILSPTESLWDQILQQHWRVNAVLLILTTVGLGFIIMITLANFVDLKPKLPSSLQPISKPGAPPIPPSTEVISLRVYPIKSCRGLELGSTRLRKTGLTLDRNWMFVEASNLKFITIRNDASMTLIDTKLVDDEKTKEQMLEISIHGTDARIVIPAFPSKDWLAQNTDLRTVEIWEQETDGYVYHDKYNNIFSDYFNKKVALVYKGPTRRLNRINGMKEMYGQDVPTNFPDVVSLLVASEASIKDLNRRLKEKHGPEQEELTIERFRPNVIISGRDDHPWEEDTWKRVSITTTIPEEMASYRLELDAIARCARCQVPNVDPDTAEKNPKEPWDELMKFRRVDTGGPAKYKPCFGMYEDVLTIVEIYADPFRLCIPRNEGIIQVGAKLEVLETTDNHLYSIRKFADL